MGVHRPPSGVGQDEGSRDVEIDKEFEVLLTLLVIIGRYVL